MNGLGKIVKKKDGTIEGSKVINSKKIGMNDNINQDENMKNRLDYDKNLNANAIAFDQEPDPNMNGKICND